MLNDKLKKELMSMRVEISDLNILSKFYVDKMNRMAFIFRTTTRKYILEEFVALRYMENGIILHLTNLDDDNSNFSFREALKQLNKLSNQQKLRRLLAEKAKKFRQNVNMIKVKHRNTRIAHINSTDDLNFDQFLNFETVLKPLIIQSNEIGDLIWGEQIHSKFKLGTHEGIIDFRQETDKLTIDLDRNKSFS